MGLPYTGWVILIFNVLFTLLATVAVGLRLWVRLFHLKLRNRQLLTDYLLIVTLMWQYVGACVGTVSSANSAGGNKKLLAQLQFVLNVQTICILSSLKFTYLSFYHEIFPNKNFRRVVYVVAGLTAIFWCVFDLPSLGYCRPIEAFWDKNIPGAHCVDAKAYELAGSITNLAIDVIIFIMPIPMIWSLRMNRRKKWTITLMFSFGVVVLCMTAVRIYEVFHADVWASNGAIALSIFACLENCLGIINACIPTLNPLLGPTKRRFAKMHDFFQRIFSRSNTDGDYGKVSSKSGSGRHGAICVEHVAAPPDHMPPARGYHETIDSKEMKTSQVLDEESTSPPSARIIDVEATTGVLRGHGGHGPVEFRTV